MTSLCAICVCRGATCGRIGSRRFKRLSRGRLSNALITKSHTRLKDTRQLHWLYAGAASLAFRGVTEGNFPNAVCQVSYRLTVRPLSRWWMQVDSNNQCFTTGEQIYSLSRHRRRRRASVFWCARQDSNLQSPESKSGTFTNLATGA